MAIYELKVFLTISHSELLKMTNLRSYLHISKVLKAKCRLSPIMMKIQAREVVFQDINPNQASRLSGLLVSLVAGVTALTKPVILLCPK